MSIPAKTPVPFSRRLVPPLPVTCEFTGKFCKCLHGRTGIVVGHKLVADTRPGYENYLRHLYYGVDYITGRAWQTFKPTPLSTGELQKITWAWGGSQTQAARQKATA